MVGALVSKFVHKVNPNTHTHAHAHATCIGFILHEQKIYLCEATEICGFISNNTQYCLL